MVQHTQKGRFKFRELEVDRATSPVNQPVETLVPFSGKDKILPIPIGRVDQLNCLNQPPEGQVLPPSPEAPAA